MASLKSYNVRKEKSKLTDLIDEAGKTVGYPRHYIGMSGLGGGCTRALWFTFRWAKTGELPGRTNRIFAVGHQSEDLMIKALESIGIELWNTLDDQDEFIDCHGYAMGHPDAYCKKIPGSEDLVHLVEFKTMNDKSFKDTKKKGVKESKPTYYSQMMIYMYKSNLTKALFMAVNKNDSSFYIEIVNCDNSFAEDMLRKGNDIVFSEDFNDFPRIGNNTPLWYECKWCNYIDQCFGQSKPLVNCRTCENLDLIGDGKFACSINDKELSLDDQVKACKWHKFLGCFS